MSGQLGDCLLHLDHHELREECYLAISAKYADYIVRRRLTLEQAGLLYALDYEHACLMEAWRLG